jgi:hypothetical protein
LALDVRGPQTMTKQGLKGICAWRRPHGCLPHRARAGMQDSTAVARLRARSYTLTRADRPTTGP